MLVSVLNKVAGLSACNFIKKKLEHRCFPMNFAKFLRTSANDCFYTSIIILIIIITIITFTTIVKCTFIV